MPKRKVKKERTYPKGYISHKFMQKWHSLAKEKKQEVMDSLSEIEQDEIAGLLLLENQSKNPLRTEIQAAEALYDKYYAIRFIMTYADVKNVSLNPEISSGQIENFNAISGDFFGNISSEFNSYYKNISTISKPNEDQLQKLIAQRNNLEKKLARIITLLPEEIPIKLNVTELHKNEFNQLKEKYKVAKNIISKEKVLHVATIKHKEKNEILFTLSSATNEGLLAQSEMENKIKRLNKLQDKRIDSLNYMSLLLELKKIVEEGFETAPENNLESFIYNFPINVFKIIKITNKEELISEVTKKMNEIIDEYTNNLNELALANFKYDKYAKVLESHNVFVNLDQPIRILEASRKKVSHIYAQRPSTQLDEISNFNRDKKTDISTAISNLHDFEKLIEPVISPYQGIIKQLMKTPEIDDISIFRNRIRSAVERYFDETFTSVNIYFKDKAASGRRIQDMKNILNALSQPSIEGINNHVIGAFSRMEVGLFKLFGSRLHRYVKKELDQFDKEIKKRDQELKREFKIVKLPPR